ncbi:unnamed protein product [Auanema sp. JU1783]|nr:unnamed protein product [Auanema sp. JU1783]
MEDDEDIAWIREESSSQTPSHLSKESERPSQSPSDVDSIPSVLKNASGNDEQNTIKMPSITIIPPQQPTIEHGTNNITPVNEVQSPTFDINEYERKLNETTIDALKLLDEIGTKSSKLVEQNKEMAQALNEQKVEMKSEQSLPPHKTIEDHVQVPSVSQLPSGGLPKNVESVLITGLEAVTGCVVLPSGLVLITDVVQGIQLFNAEGTVIKKVSNSEWHNPRSPLSYKDHVLLLADVRIDGEYLRYILKFTSDLEYVAKIEGPQWLVGRTVLSDRLSIAHTDHIYLSACGQISSAIYELSPVGQWTELDFRQSESYVDMLAFATIGTITQLLVVEGRKNYVLQLSVRESQIVDRRRIAICQRPGALARDDAGRLFVADKATACIHLVDTVRWVSEKNLACTESVVPCFSAKWGLLAIPIKTAVRLQKYSFR